MHRRKAFKLSFRIHDRLYRKMLALGFVARLVGAGHCWGARRGFFVLAGASSDFLCIHQLCCIFLEAVLVPWLSEGGAIGALVGAVLLILVPAYAPTSKA